MKKYTIKEFAEGKKAVKIENEEQWNKLNKVHKLTRQYEGRENYTNRNTYCLGGLTGWETLEFSQLDFEDEFVVGKWYRITKKENRIKYIKYLKTEFTGYFWCSEHISNMYGNYGGTFGINDAKDLAEASLEEIQQYLPEGHVNLIKKDTFVLPEYWYVVVTEENKEVLSRWRFDDQPSLNLDKYIGGIVGLLPKYPNSKNHNTSKDKDWNRSIEITFEQFQQYVLKTTKTMEKEIIEYRVIERYHNLAKSLFTECRPDNKGGYGRFDVDSNVKDFFKKAGVLDLWFEKVYALKYSLPTINGYSGKMEGDFIIYGSNCAKFHKDFFIDLSSIYNLDGNRYLKSIKLSSDVEISIEEIKQIVEYINNK